MSKERIDALNKEKVLWARLSIVSNTILMVLKIIVGFFTFSISIISEALHSGMDLIASFIAAYSVQKSSQPADEEHKFGHGKFENASGFFEAVLIGVAAILIIYEAGLKIVEGPKLQFVGLGIMVMLVSVVVNTLVAMKLHKVAKKTDSIAIEADAAHLSTDVWTSLGVLIGFVVIWAGEYFGIAGIYYLDPIIAIGVALLILAVAMQLTKRSFSDLIDVSLPKEEEDKVKKIIEDHYGKYVEYHEMRSRKAGSERHIDLHLVVPRNAGLKEAHDLADHIENDIKAAFLGAQVLIHLEPCEGECKECPKSAPCEDWRAGK